MNLKCERNAKPDDEDSWLLLGVGTQQPKPLISHNDEVGAKGEKYRWKLVAECLQMPTTNANKTLTLSTIR